jgi:hypothetical protein
MELLPITPAPAVHEFVARPEHGIAAGLVLPVVEANHAWAELHAMLEMARFAPVPMRDADAHLRAMVKLYAAVVLRENGVDDVTVWVTRNDADALANGLRIALDVKKSTGGVSSATAHVRAALHKIERLING